MISVLSPSHITQLIGGLDGGPSPFGISYYKKLLECPKKARLNEEYAALKAEEEQEEPEEQPARKSDKLNMAHVGIHGHQLFEQRWKQQLGANIAMDLRDPTPELTEAIRIYNNFNAEWGDLQSYLGMHITGAETRLGEEPDVAAKVKALLGGVLTGRSDADGDLYDSERLARNTGHYLLPGRWIVDYKFGKAHKKGDKAEYENSLQGAAYNVLDEIYNPDNPAQGVLFVRIIGHKQMLRGSSYVVYVCPKRPTDVHRLRALIRMAQAAKELEDGNPLACRSAQFGDECYFFRQKICPGY